MSSLSYRQQNQRFFIGLTILILIVPILWLNQPETNVESKPVPAVYSVTEDLSSYSNMVSAQEGNYLVVEGDEWGDLAVKFHTTTKQLIEVNSGTKPGTNKPVSGEWINIPFPND
jgi:hypothetical protein